MRSAAVSFVFIFAMIAGCAAQTEPEPIGESLAGLQSLCTSDDDCGGGTCNTSQCLSCCAPGEVCIAVCCGTCESPRPPRPSQCLQVLCAEGYEPITDALGCDHGCRPITGTPCGPGRCAAGQVCCNESCGICTEPGGFCTQQICEPIELL